MQHYGGLNVVQNLQLELSQLIDARVQAHWDTKIQRGIIPTEVIGKVDPQTHFDQMQGLAEFEEKCVIEVLEGLRDSLRPEEDQVHYFGIGRGFALRKVLTAANTVGLDVIAYDISEEGCKHGCEVVDQLGEPGQIGYFRHNAVVQADIEFACDERVIHPDHARLLISSRVLDVLDNVFRDNQKMIRTLRRMGSLLQFLRVLVIHPEPDGNEHAKFRDTTVSSLEYIAGYLAEGLGSAVGIERLGRHDFHNHLYTAGVFYKL